MEFIELNIDKKGNTTTIVTSHIIRMVPDQSTNGEWTRIFLTNNNVVPVVHTVEDIKKMMKS